MKGRKGREGSEGKDGSYGGRSGDFSEFPLEHPSILASVEEDGTVGHLEWIEEGGS